jgi:hypothetical protein
MQKQQGITLLVLKAQPVHKVHRANKVSKEM